MAIIHSLRKYGDYTVLHGQDIASNVEFAKARFILEVYFHLEFF